MNLADIIAHIESNNNQYAQRFEKLHLGASSPTLLSNIVKAHGGQLSLNTADVYAAMSHGLFQIMGFRLWGDASRDTRNLSYKGTLWDFLINTDLQRSLFQSYCEQNAIAFRPEQLEETVVRENFATIYNGPGNVEVYADRIAVALHALKNATGQ